MDGKLRSDDTVSVEEWSDFVRGRKLLDRSDHDEKQQKLFLRSEISTPTIEGTVAADMSGMDIRQELFQSGE